MISYIITFLAGCSTLIGYLFIYLKNNSNRVLISSLAFASGVMFLISITDLIPSSFSSISSVYYVIPVVIGVVLSMMIDKYLPESSYNDSGLFRVGLISMLAIMMHNIPEGCSCYVS